jgi:two-component system sensor histidine kinase YesM
MTIQPIIENAVKCGLEPLNRPGRLSVTAYATETELCISIEDDGVGMQEAVLDHLIRSLQVHQKTEDVNQGRRGIGLPNVHRRIALMYGEPYGLRIQSKSGEGTTVTIVLPLPKGRGDAR